MLIYKYHLNKGGAMEKFSGNLNSLKKLGVIFSISILNVRNKRIYR